MADRGFLAFLQFISVLACLGIIMVGAVQFHNTSGALALEWCKEDGDHKSHCWTKNTNTRAALTMYSITLIFLGVLALACELNAKDLKRPPGFLMFPGLLALGAARNLGIVLGGFAMLCGFIQAILFLANGQSQGPFKIGGGHTSRCTTYLVQIFAVLFSLGVSAVGIMAIVALAESGSDAGLKWWKPASKEAAWFGHGAVIAEDYSEYAIGAYAAALVLLGILNCLANLKMLHTSLHGWALLGPCGIMLGVLALGAAGNSGILVGGFMMVFGFAQWILAILYHQSDGYMSLR